MDAVTPAERRPARVVSLSEVRAQRVAAREQRTLSDAWDCYLASMGMERKAASSKRKYEQVMRVAREGATSPRGDIEPLPGRPSIAEVTLWHEQVARVRSPSTANNYLRVLRGITARAMLITKDVDIHTAFKLVPELPLAARERRDAKPGDVARLLAVAAEASPAHVLAVRLGAFYGMRVAEVLGVRRDAVRENYGLVTLVVTHQRDRDGYRLRKNWRHGKTHVLSIFDPYDKKKQDTVTRDLLTRLCDARERLKCVQGFGDGLAEYLVPWSYLYAARWFVTQREAGIVQMGKGDAWHTLRHFNGTALAAEGANITEIQSQMGQSTDGAARTYMGQVRGTTNAGSSRVLAAFDRAVKESGQHHVLQARDAGPSDVAAGEFCSPADESAVPHP